MSLPFKNGILDRTIHSLLNFWQERARSTSTGMLCLHFQLFFVVLTEKFEKHGDVAKIEF